MPKQSELDALYRAGSPLVIRVEWADERSDTLSLADVAVLSTETDLKGSRYLEIGVGKGALFEQVARRGADVVGVEPGAWGHHLHGVVNSLEEIAPGSEFDVIVANDVLEHLENPIVMLSTLRAHSRPSTRLYCRFPNSRSLRARIRKDRWNMVRPLGHLHYFSKQSATRMFARSGWLITKAQPQDVFPQPLVSRALNLIRQGDQWMVQARPVAKQTGWKAATNISN